MGTRWFVLEPHSCETNPDMPIVAPNVGDPMGDCSTLELISPDLWITLDG